MQIGKLRHKIDLQNYVIIKNVIGESQKLYSTYASVWSEIKPVSANNKESGQQEQYELSHIITVRYNGTIDQKDRVKFNDSYFEIVEIINYDSRKLYQIVKAKEIHPQSEIDLNVDASGHSEELINYIGEDAGDCTPFLGPL